MTVERGSDPRDFAMFAYGGGGGLFAAPIAADLSIPTVVVPRGASTLSAWGIAGAPYREDASVPRSAYAPTATAPSAGTEINLIQIRAESLLGIAGVEGGGAYYLWLPPG